MPLRWRLERLVRLQDSKKVHKLTCHISGHLDLSPNEFKEHYVPKLDEAIAKGYSFVVGDAPGADLMAQSYLFMKTNDVVVYHMYDVARHNVGFVRRGGYISDLDRDAAMTAASDADIAWVRPGREKSGTAKNIERRSVIKVWGNTTATQESKISQADHLFQDGRTY